MKYFLVILIISIAATSSSQSQNRETDSLALRAIYDSLDGPNWGTINGETAWDLTKPIDTYLGVEVLNNRVVKLELSDPLYGLKGGVPNIIGELSELEYLKIGGVNKMPSKIGDLKNLKELIIYKDTYVDFNLIIPSDIGSLINLKKLSIYNSWMNYNDFSLGEIPASFFELVNLETLYLEDHISNIEGGSGYFYSALEYGYFFENLHRLSNLKEIYLYNLQGYTSLTPDFAQLANLETAVIENCNLIGAIPSEVVNMKCLKHLSVFKNSLSVCPDLSIMNLSSLDITFNLIDYASIEPMLMKPNFLDNNQITIFPQMLPEDIDTLCIGKNYSISSPYQEDHLTYHWSNYRVYNSELDQETDAVINLQQQDEDLDLVHTIYSTKYPDIRFSNWNVYDAGDNYYEIYNAISRRSSGEDCPILAADQESNYDNISIFPNPTTNFLYLESPKKIQSMAIFNMSGIEVLRTEIIAQSDIQIDISHFDSGIYLVELHSQNKECAYFRIMKN